MKKYLPVIALIICQFGFAQIPKGTDVFMLNCKFKAGNIELENPINITSREGYDNQPCFSEDEKYLYFVSIKDDNQADIYQYSINSNSITQLSHTSESEYSPRPYKAGKFITTVRVEKDSTQRFKSFSLTDNSFLPICMQMDSIGYYNWINEKIFVFFKITQIPSMWLINKEDCEEKFLASNVGRCMIPKSENEVYFTQLLDSTRWICSINFSTQKISKIIPCLKGSEDFALFDKDNFIQGNQSKLFNFNANTMKDWKEIADFKNQGVSSIKRIVINKSNSKIAFVNDVSTP